tara:strand:+ start:257 stop:415 length:159 start_codon:yes stop_codon:yes gene_type:complete
LLSSALPLAVSMASFEISIAVQLVLENIFFKAIIIHPDPVPTSNISFKESSL